MLLDTILGWFSMDMGIDLGTCATLVCVRGEGIVLNEPSVVAVRKGTNVVLNNGQAVGSVAREMLGKTPGSISAVRPLKDGVISDFEITEAMLGYFIRKVHDRTRLIRPRVVIAVPSGITAVERRAVIDSAERAGARKVYLVDEPMAAGIGSGLPITDPTASMIVDIGGGTTEVAILSLADIASCESIRVGGDDMDEAIINHLKRTYNLLIGEARAEKVKIQIGSAVPLEQELTMEIAGRDTISGLPRKIVITSEEIREALREPIASIIDAVTATLEKVEPELAADLIDNGVYICGGGSLLRGMDAVLANATGLKVQRVEDPLSSVAQGTSIYMENLELWKDTMDHSEHEW
ncbi:MAG: rod shape-determining protein MreB [Coxiella sp. DG_40]|nr:MAG: rod shape-determining protein MreB [Coxiella sp. DG_40]